MRYHYNERIGGAEVQAWLLAKELARQGHDVSYIGESLTGKSNSTESIDNVTVYWIPQRLHFDVLNTFKYYSILKKISPDIIMQRYTCLYTGIIGHYARLYWKPFVWICTDDKIPKTNLFKKREKESLRSERKALHKKLILMSNAWLRDLFRYYGMKYVTHPCVQNSVQYDILYNNFGMEAYHFPSGHQLPKNIPPKAQPPMILWAANMGRTKRPELFIELAQACKDINAKFVMVGNHPDREYVSCLFRSTKNICSFQWMGALTFEKTLSFFDLTTIFVNTSEADKEGYPNTFIQSWLRGIPVISFGVDPDDIITKKHLGKIVFSIEDARAAIIKYLDGDNMDAISAEIRYYASHNFNISSVANRFYSIVSDKGRLG